MRRTYLDLHPMCEMCRRQGLLVDAEHVDHITPITKGGDPLNGDNLQALCPPCHSRKTAQDEGKAVRWGCTVDGIPIDPKSHWHRS